MAFTDLNTLILLDNKSAKLYSGFSFPAREKFISLSVLDKMEVDLLKDPTSDGQVKRHARMFIPEAILANSREALQQMLESTISPLPLSTELMEELMPADAPNYSLGDALNAIRILNRQYTGKFLFIGNILRKLSICGFFTLEINMADPLSRGKSNRGKKYKKANDEKSNS